MENVTIQKPKNWNWTDELEIYDIETQEDEKLKIPRYSYRR